jgi:hypothetical protein
MTVVLPESMSAETTLFLRLRSCVWSASYKGCFATASAACSALTPLDFGTAAVAVFRMKGKTVKRDGDKEGEKSMWTVRHAGEHLAAKEMTVVGKGDSSSSNDDDDADNRLQY